MRVAVDWNELLIEQGTLDPLGLWRVGDRMIAELLAPFTTVVTNRPARYLSMYSWLLSAVPGSAMTDRSTYWARFFKLECVLLCAIASHAPHRYEGFSGQIGSETAAKLLAKAQGSGTLDLRTFKKVTNGWETNYKGSMQQFGLVVADFGHVAGLALTPLGQRLASAYGLSLERTAFFRGGLDRDEFLLSEIAELASESCTCLLHPPWLRHHRAEREECITVLLHESGQRNHVDDTWRSMGLIQDTLVASDILEVPLSGHRFRRLLSTGLIDDIDYSVPSHLRQTYRRWQVYNLDSLFVYALELGLAGFLQVLQSGGGSIPIHEIKLGEFQNAFDELGIELKSEGLFVIHPSVDGTLEAIASLSPNERLRIEQFLASRHKVRTGRRLFAIASLYFVYSAAVFRSFLADPQNEDAVAFYRKRAFSDGREASLLHVTEAQSHTPDIQSFVHTTFLQRLVIDRQLQTRTLRDKEQAWFTQVSETGRYEWENSYTPTMYRADRFGIFVSFLHSLGLVQTAPGGWRPFASEPHD